MTQEEKNLFTQQIDSLKEYMKVMFEGLERTLKNQQADISAMTAKANDNQIQLIQLSGRVDVIEKVKETEGKLQTENREITRGGIKKWQMVAGVISVVAVLIFNILNLVIK